MILRAFRASFIKDTLRLDDSLYGLRLLDFRAPARILRLTLDYRLKW